MLASVQPRRSATTEMATPAMSIWLAAVCRRSCNRTRATPARVLKRCHACEGHARLQCVTPSSEKTKQPAPNGTPTNSARSSARSRVLAKHFLGVRTQSDRVRAICLRTLLDRPVLGLSDRTREGDDPSPEVDVAPAQCDKRPAPSTNGRRELHESGELRRGHILDGPDLCHRRDVELTGLHSGRIRCQSGIAADHVFSHGPVEHRPDLPMAAKDHRRRETGLLFEVPVEPVKMHTRHIVGVPRTDGREDVEPEVVYDRLGGLRRPAEPVPAAAVLSWPVRILPSCRDVADRRTSATVLPLLGITPRLDRSDQLRETSVGKLGPSSVLRGADGLVDGTAPTRNGVDPIGHRQPPGPVLEALVTSHRQTLIAELCWRECWRRSNTWRGDCQIYRLNRSFISSPNGIRTRVSTLRG